MNNGGPAFPAIDFVVSGDLSEEGVRRLGYVRGMYLRDYFAAKAMQGYIACDVASMTAEGYARRAYQIADAMIQERDK